jgi:hypothetical protein
MSRLSPNLMNAPVDQFQSDLPSNTSANVLFDGSQTGPMITGSDGREFRWVQAGASNLVAGNLVAGPVTIANHVAKTPSAAAAVGATTVTITLGSTAATVGYYNRGYAVVVSGAGAGYSYQINTSSAAISGGVITLNLSDPLIVAWDASTTAVTLIPHQYTNVVQNPTTPLGQPVGVANWILPATSYGWVQTFGTTAVLSQGGITIALGCAPSTSTPGAVAVVAATTSQVGTAIITSTDGQIAPVFLNVG